jgi:uncharacterized protein (TIGR03435 family)
MMGARDLIVLAVAAASLTAQSPARPAFDAVSIKPTAPSSGFAAVRAVADRLVAEEATLRALIQFAYQTADGRRFLNSQIFDAPRWVESDRFSVQAKAGAVGGAATERQIRRMTQVMLEDRFQLTTHREQRELPVYDLVVSKGGSKLTRAPDQTPTTVEGNPIALDPTAPPRGRFQQFGRPSPSGAITLTITGTAVTMTAFVGVLQQYVDRPLVNSSGAAGLYDVRLEFALPQSQSATTDDAPGVSIFTAVQEQLGLKLDTVKKRVEVLVVDHAEHPTPD